MLITSQDFRSGMFLYKKIKKYDILYIKKVKNDYLEVKQYARNIIILWNSSYYVL